MDILCILNLKNRQEEYAAALEFIKAVEEEKGCAVNKRKKILLEMAKKISISIGNVQKNISARYLEQPIKVTERGKNRAESIQNMHEFGEKDTVILERKNQNIRYQIRIHFNSSINFDTIEESELMYLQYLAMFLKRVSDFFVYEEKTELTEVLQRQIQTLNHNSVEQELKKHLTVFIVPITGNVYPYENQNGKIDYNTYNSVSRYLRLLSKQYTGVIYGVDKSSNHPVVTSLDFHKNRKCKTHFPLTIIDKQVYDSLFTVSVDNILDELFSLKNNGRFRNSRDENPKNALEDFIAETALYRIRSFASSECCAEIFRFLKSCSNITLMEFSLFAFMLSNKSINANSNDSSNGYMSVWQLAHEIAQGLRQVVQNAIQHTESKECFLSFYLHEKGVSENSSSFVGRITKRYPNTYFDTSVVKEVLEVFVSDLNDKEDMVENFISNLNYECNEGKKHGTVDGLAGHSKLINCREKLAIRNFFSVYDKEDAKQEWKCFRQEDVVAHIGLSQFAQTIDKCKASVNVISSKDSKLTDPRKIFCHAYGEENRGKFFVPELNRDCISVIPGTQFSLLIPIQTWNVIPSMGIGQLKQQNHIAENYFSFAAFLDYGEKRILMPEEKEINSGQMDILDAKRKYRLVQMWRCYWEKQFSKNIEELRENSVGTHERKYIFNYDFDNISTSYYFSSDDRIEVCLKGIINALDSVNNLEQYFLIALTNLPERFIEVFRKICVQLSVRRFPNKLQICLHEKQDGEKKNKRIVMLGSDFSQAIYNAYILSMEQGVDGFDKEDCEKASDIKEILMSELNTHEKYNQQDVTGVCPFDVILNCSETDKRSFFEKQLKEMAEGSLDEELVGYKLNNTHMRLGSKVHIESFYEMSFLFYRTTIANRLAFKILKQMQEGVSGKNDTEKKIDLVRDNILFYGYASYSKAILTSINEILREYRKIHSSDSSGQMEDKIAIASFQHNLMLESEETQMYYDLPSENFPGNVDTSGCLNLWGKIKVIQIVPISSTLTTFDKMWRKFLGSIIKDRRDNIYLAGNYTVFWVVDKNGNLEDGMPSETEEKYWEKVFPNHQIKTKLPILNEKNKEISTDDKMNKENMDIQYIIRSSVVWHDPLRCELCYPKYVINEIPLVETDATSTVPTQQIRYREYKYNGDSTIATATEYDRFTKLQGCVFYDHICRRQNHYQFYIDTQRYFYNVKNMVKNWLVEQSNEVLYETNEPVLHIIFSPEHNTNVGFVQYVNTYYFNGLAEIVSINVDKQFRSNFICEHAAIKRMIEELHRDRHDMKNLPVKFYFVDDTVITGDTLEKANGLLHSLVPSNEYQVNLFSKIFVLVDRLSDETKQSYVDSPDKNFMAFLHIDVSNVRTHGDSCIGCKLEQDAEKLYKRSATRNMAKYWFGKLKDYRKKPYDNKNEMRFIDSSKSYRMLLFSHVLQNVIVKQGNCYTLGDVYDIVINLSLWLLEVDDYQNKSAYGYKKYLQDMRNMNGVCTLLKTICRPFFSYDFKIKRQVYTFFIFLAELFLGEKRSCIFPNNLEENEKIAYLLDNDRISKMDTLVKHIKKRITEEKKSELDFLKDYLLEGLTDMGSTYVMRMQTLKKVYNFIEIKGENLSLGKKKDFWNSYEVNIHRLATGNADESRELWLEYMYITGMEYREFYDKNHNNNSYKPKFFYETIANNSLENVQDKYFYQFCNNLFMQNIGINFDELEEKCSDQQSVGLMDGNFLKDYRKQMRRLDSFDNPLLDNAEKELTTKSEEKLFVLLKSGTNEVIEPSVNQWYEKFLKYIVDVINEKYNIEKKSINIAMLTGNNANEKHINRIQFFDIVQEIVNSREIIISETRYRIKERVVAALESSGLFELENNGYTISEGNDLHGEKRPYVIAFFDNPGKAKQQRSLARIFLYISIADDILIDKKGLTLRLILRDVLMYRNRILRFLEKDFAGEIYANYAHTIGERNILSHEKAHSHNTTADDAISLEIFQGEKLFGEKSDYAILEKGTAAEWLLLRNYTNGQIAKMFNRSFHDHPDDVYSLNSPMLYIPNDSINYSNSLFKQKLDSFSRLNLKNENQGVTDDRFKLLNQIIDIQYDKTLDDAEFIQGKKGQFYNLEYFKCILIDIMFSATKFESDRPDYLLRIDRFLEIKDKLENKVKSWDTDDEEIVRLIKKIEDSRCSIKFFRDIALEPDFDYLVIQNPVKEMDNSLGDWKEQNKIINHRLNNPLDYADGHMSLLAIKRYIENLDEDMNLECSFQYVADKKDNEHEELYFENRLPILKKEGGR